MGFGPIGDFVGGAVDVAKGGVNLVKGATGIAADVVAFPLTGANLLVEATGGEAGFYAHDLTNAGFDAAGDATKELAHEAVATSAQIAGDIAEPFVEIGEGFYRAGEATVNAGLVAAETGMNWTIGLPFTAANGVVRATGGQPGATFTDMVFSA